MEKNYLSFENRLCKLRQRGMNIPVEQEVIIRKYNYYNLINGYKVPFLENKNNYPAFANPSDDFYIRGTQPKHLEALYQFDEKLRLIFLEKILKIEDKLKDILVQAFYEYHTDNGGNTNILDILHRESEYLKRDYYNLVTEETYHVTEKSGFRYTVFNRIDKDDTMRKRPMYYKIDKDKTYYSLIKNLYTNIGNQRRKNKSIQAYIDKHTYIPMWVLTNILTFGNISKLYEIQTIEVQKLVLNKLNLLSATSSQDKTILNFSRVIHILSLFRNVCAHNERFYCSDIYTPIDDEFMDYLGKFPFKSEVMQNKGTNQFLRDAKLKKLRNYRNGLYTLMFCISLFLDNQELKDFKNQIKRELDSLSSRIPPRSMHKVLEQSGLNFDWNNHLIK